MTEPHSPHDSTHNGADRVEVRVYDELRKLARVHMAGERVNHTLQATALANEVFLRLANDNQAQRATPKEYLSLASTAIRRILIDHARAKGCEKRGGKVQTLSLDDLDFEFATEAILPLDEFLEDLAKRDPRLAKIAEQRTFGQMTTSEIAKAHALSVGKVHGMLCLAQAILLREANQSQ